MKLETLCGWLGAAVIIYLAWAWYSTPPIPVAPSSPRQLGHYLDESLHQQQVRYMDRMHEVFGPRDSR